MRKERGLFSIFARFVERMRIVHGGERGFGLAESLVAVAILGIGITGAVAALSTGSMSVNLVNQQTNAHSLALSQLAYTKSYPFNAVATTYPIVDTAPHPIIIPAGYSIAVGVSSVPSTNTDIQKITVTISKDGSTILSVDDFKVNR